jgi:hypothetical protein
VLSSRLIYDGAGLRMVPRQISSPTRCRRCPRR